MKLEIEYALKRHSRKRYLAIVFAVVGLIAVLLATIWVNRFEYREVQTASGATVTIRADKVTGAACVVGAGSVLHEDEIKAAVNYDWCSSRKRRPPS